MFFGLFDTPEKKARNSAREWLEVAQKIYHYRRDRLSETDLAALQQSTADLRQQLESKSGVAQLEQSVLALEKVLRRTGGTHYPKSSIVENVEFFLVASIVILGIRMYIAQPFKIPTNSMWPSYNGMTPEVFHTKEEEPNPLSKLARFAAFGAVPKTVNAAADGEVLIPVAGQRRGMIKYQEVPGRSWGVLPAIKREYALWVGDQFATTQVPIDFDFDWVIREAFFPSYETLADALSAKLANGEFVDKIINTARGPERIRFIRTGKIVKAGDRVLAFDIMTGDQLFVDRVSYHFVKPQAGDGFVFRTDHIDHPDMKDSAGRQVEQYYIKRLAGTPGDTLEIRGYGLYRNGEPATGSKSYDLNAKRENNYVGFRGTGILSPGQVYTVPANSYIALGDNSANSLDSRYWGAIPAKDVVGRPIFIYYPFTRRWGAAP